MVWEVASVSPTTPACIACLKSASCGNNDQPCKQEMCALTWYVFLGSERTGEFACTNDSVSDTQTRGCIFSRLCYDGTWKIKVNNRIGSDYAQKISTNVSSSGEQAGRRASKKTTRYTRTDRHQNYRGLQLQ